MNNKIKLWVGIILIPMLSLSFGVGVRYIVESYFSSDENKVSVDITLSSISLPEGKIDIYWDISIPEEEKQKTENPSLSYPVYGYEGAIAKPLDLIEKVNIKNTTKDSIFVKSIRNEQISHLDTPPRQGTKATPIMLLPNSFFDKDGEEYTCLNRSIDSLIQNAAFISSFGPQNSQNNICEFVKPIEIKSNSSLVLKPDLYIVSHNKFNGHAVTGIFRKDVGKDFVKVSNMSTNGDTWLIPERYKEYDDFARKDTFNIGGFIVADSGDEKMLNEIIQIKDVNGDDVYMEVDDVSRGIAMRSYHIPTEVFIPSNRGFDENILGMQMFWYINDFWSGGNVTGVFDSDTKNMLENFQKETGIVETGQFDEATMFITRAFDNQVSLYENYGDEEITLGFNAPDNNFRLFSIGTHDVRLNDDMSSFFLVSKIERESGVIKVYSAGGDKISTLGKINILNNTNDIMQCELLDSKGSKVKEFNIPINGIYRQETKMKGISGLEIFNLNCGSKSLQIEMTPELESFG